MEWVLLGLAVVAAWGWSLIKVASDADRRTEEWLAEDDERRQPNWRRI